MPDAVSQLTPSARSSSLVHGGSLHYPTLCRNPYRRRSRRCRHAEAPALARRCVASLSVGAVVVAGPRSLLALPDAVSQPFSKAQTLLLAHGSLQPCPALCRKSFLSVVAVVGMRRLISLARCCIATHSVGAVAAAGPRRQITLPDAASQPLSVGAVVVAGARRLNTLARRCVTNLPIDAVVVAGTRRLFALARRCVAQPFRWCDRRSWHTEAHYPFRTLCRKPLRWRSRRRWHTEAHCTCPTLSRKPSYGAVVVAGA